MKTHPSLITGAALAGILSGGFAISAAKASTPNGTQKDGATFSVGIQAADEKGDTHDCKGKNSCKNKGGCKSGDAGCAGKNSCKGKGGCAMKDGKPAHKEAEGKPSK